MSICRGPGSYYNLLATLSVCSTVRLAVCLALSLAVNCCAQGFVFLLTLPHCAADLATPTTRSQRLSKIAQLSNKLACQPLTHTHTRNTACASLCLHAWSRTLHYWPSTPRLTPLRLPQLINMPDQRSSRGPLGNYPRWQSPVWVLTARWLPYNIENNLLTVYINIQFERPYCCSAPRTTRPDPTPSAPPPCLMHSCSVSMWHFDVNSWP